jgi:hypothetical protein
MTLIILDAALSMPRCVFYTGKIMPLSPAVIPAPSSPRAEVRSKRRRPFRSLRKFLSGSGYGNSSSRQVYRDDILPVAAATDASREFTTFIGSGADWQRDQIPQNLSDRSMTARPPLGDVAERRNAVDDLEQLGTDQYPRIISCTEFLRI